MGLASHLLTDLIAKKSVDIFLKKLDILGLLIALPLG